MTNPGVYNLNQTAEIIMSITAAMMQTRPEARPLYAAIIAGLACAFVIGKTLPIMMDTLSTVLAPLCAVGDTSGSMPDAIEPISSHALPNVPGKRVTIVRVFYGPGGVSPAHRPAGSGTAFHPKSESRPQLG